MIVHYLNLAWKVFQKNKYYALISIAGLVCGMLSVLTIGKYVGASLVFDNFHVKRNQIYSISQQEAAGDHLEETPSTYLGVVDVVSQFPEVLQTTRYMQHVEALVMTKREDGTPESFTENKIFMTDSTFLKVFTFPFIHGNSESALRRVHSMVLTESTARKYFSDGNAIGQTLTIRTSWGQEINYEVTGVIQEIPRLSKFQFDFLITHSTTNAEELWNLPDYSIHVVLKQNTKPSDLEKKLTAQVNEIPQLKSAGKNVTLSLRPLAEIRLSNIEYLLLTIGIMITIICWTNYINQSIAQAYWRTKEVGVLKILGATRANLTGQFAIESVLICFAAFLLVVGVYLTLEEWLQTFTNGHLLPLTSNAASVNTIFLFIFLAGIVLSTVAPTLVVFRQSVEHTLRNPFTPEVGGIAIRKIFVVVQFSISAILLVGIFVVSGQLDYLERKDKGFNMDNLLIVKAPMAKDTTWLAKRKTLQLFKEQTAELPFVTKVASSTTVPGEEYRQETYLTLQGDDRKILVHQNGVDENFFSLYDIQFVAGRNFLPDARAKNSESIILNESAARALGFSDISLIINSKVIDHENSDVAFDVIGVVRDYHQTSLKYEIRPLAFRYNVFRGHCSLKLDPTVQLTTNDNRITSLKEIWTNSYPDASFDYYFLGEKFRAQDQEDQYFASLFKAFTSLSVILSCLGLFGLSILVSTKRQKEIGVRKTFGATSFDILFLFIKGYAGPLVAALIIGSSGAYFLMNDWLTNYANRIEIGPWLILSALITLVVIFSITVSYHTIKAAMTSPVKVLRN